MFFFVLSKKGGKVKGKLLFCMYTWKKSEKKMNGGSRVWGEEGGGGVREKSERGKRKREKKGIIETSNSKHFF